MTEDIPKPSTAPHVAPVPSHRWLRWIVSGLSVVILALAALNVASWHTHALTNKTFIPKILYLKPNTALCMLLLALSILCRQARRLRYLGDAFCAFSFLVTALTVWEYISGRSIGIDLLLASVPSNLSSDPTGRMSLGTALDATLVALALFVLDRVPWLSITSLAVCSMISLSALVGYVFSAEHLLKIPLLRSMAVRTALSLAAIELATLLLRPYREPVRSLMRTADHHRTGIWFLIATCVLPLVIGWPVSYLYRRGALDPAVAFTLFVVLLIAVQGFLVTRNSRSLARVEDRRNIAEAERARLEAEQQQTYLDLVASEKKAAKSEAQYRLLTDALPAYISYLDTDLRYVRVNRTYLEWFDKTAEDIEGKLLEEVLGDSAKNVRLFLEAALAGNSQQFETRMGTAQGERILSVSHIPDVDANGRIRGVVVMGHDVTARRQAEEGLRDSEARFRALSEHSPLGIFQADLGSRITYVNQQVLNTFGRKEKELLGLSWLRFVHPADLHRLADDWPIAIAENRPYQAEYRIIFNDGEERTVLGRSVMIRDEHGQPSSVVGTLDDITARRKTEAALRQTEKLAAVGKLASSIAHEINNPLESVTNLLYLAQTSDTIPDVRQHLELAEQELRRVSAIANQTLRFHRQATKPIPVTAEELFGTVLAVYQGRLNNSRVTIRERYRSTEAITVLDGEIRQVLNNLVGNAIDAMHGTGGTLYIRSRDAIHPTTGQRGLILTVADTGMGMTQKTLSNLFEAFFTTKGIGGTGLGLWVSKEIIERHHGSIWLRSSDTPGRSGTLFSLFLPSESNPEEVSASSTL